MRKFSAFYFVADFFALAFGKFLPGMGPPTPQTKSNLPARS